MFQAVTVTQADSCITYVLKRIGYTYTSNDNIDRDWLFKKLNNPDEFIKVNLESLKPGDIIASIKRIPHKPLAVPVHISKDGRIITKQILSGGFHAMVYEGNDIVSEHRHPEYRGQNTSQNSFGHMVIFQRSLSQILKKIKETDKIVSYHRWLHF